MDADDVVLERLKLLRNEVDYLKNERLGGFDAFAQAMRIYLEGK